MHIPDDPLYYEKFYFTPGDLGFQRADTFGPAGRCVCWDQWYPEAARLTALAGAQIIFYPTAIGWLANGEAGVRREPACRLGNDDAQPCHRQWRVRGGRQSDGVEDEIEFSGASFVCDPMATCWPGRCTTQKKRCWWSAIWPRSTRFARIGRFLRDRRIDAYGGLTRRVSGLTTQLK